MPDNQERLIVITQLDGDGIIRSEVSSDTNWMHTKSIIGANYDELIEQIRKMRDFSFAYDFFEGVGSELSAEQKEALRNAVLEFASPEEAHYYYLQELPAYASKYVKKIMSSKDVRIILTFLERAAGHIECSEFEDDLFSIDSTTKCHYLVRIATLFPKLNKDKVLEAIIKKQDFESLVEFYDFSGRPDFDTIVKMAVESKNAAYILPVAMFASCNESLSEKYLRRLEEEFLRFCTDAKILYDYMKQVGCINRGRFIEQLVLHDGKAQLDELFDNFDWQGKKEVYQYISKIGDDEMKEHLKRKTSIINRVLWSILK